jgi:hypothetical protein
MVSGVFRHADLVGQEGRKHVEVLCERHDLEQLDNFGANVETCDAITAR